ncbi:MULTISPECIES: glutamate--cysteine ligase [unclassified Arthrobacter]|uniref:glutamate--cysteine ligase n=1 Tax=unclassified Arthrobacter TaxID=235627 RepID=UPI001D13A5F9|nr:MULTISPECIES: glutamate--cysteine ligase [unclassified Arthrobacter]MCC3277346.1 glutamate--cysteine ligase [Arthrobacter sp. zg-Y20]MCC3280054.1 glutamate--cysteine ligase [Arthrobacter sp. zg-Y40]MCC9178200.1 glutamate--cysteine ligase [Arthrobacter sp. zg-Y750]MDK1317506.1 glutamate--cysteine ligase [Arthrobacter sp. zg.Y20]WIB06994.1 glutamate--cysteine ligase [Arthrobacter sp. zg-Y20]
MGAEVSSRTFSRAQRTAYRQRLLENLDHFAHYLSTAQFADSASIGLELELNLTNRDFSPALRNQAVLERIADPAFQTEIGAFNIEMNHPAMSVGQFGLKDLEDSLRAQLNRADERAAQESADIMMVGILPTLTPGFMDGWEWLSSGQRYAALNTSVLQARGEDVLLDLSGPEPLSFYAQNIAPEAACTSVQLHLEVSPEEFAPAWNAAQMIAAPQVALAANSPVFMEHLLWHETRIELFKQAIDTRPPEMRNQGVRPRVWFGERWITSIFDLFEENVRYFPALLPELSGNGGETTPFGAPLLPELRLHNGTVYRWNRPIYDPGSGTPNLRLENRVLPAGPSVLDVVANAAFYYGLVEYIRTADRPLWSRVAFKTASDNFLTCARHGLEATVYWPGIGEIPVAELIVRHLIPQAAEGLRDLKVDASLIDRYLNVVTERARTEQNGAAWQIAMLRRLEESGLSRPAALSELSRRYWENMHSNAAVHSWPL